MCIQSVGVCGFKSTAWNKIKKKKKQYADVFFVFFYWPGRINYETDASGRRNVFALHKKKKKSD